MPAADRDALRYLPPRHHWSAVAPATLGLKPGALDAAVAYHLAHESTWSRDFLTRSGRYIGVADEPEAAGDVLGPVRPRGGPSGLVLRHGRIVAEWGDTARADMSFSIAKSYLAVLAGLAISRGRLRDLDDRVQAYRLDGDFESEQNRAITWRHLLEQTSEWQGVLWGKPDSIDHNRDVGKSELGFAVKGQTRPLQVPGTFWEYNDVRVNRLSLALLRLFREPLPDVLRSAVMDPVGASLDWAWLPYRNSWVEIDGVRMPSVPGGSHWGGGLWMSTRDHARLGLLMLRRGRWGDREILPAAWVDEMTRPAAVNPGYGLLWWLNTGRQQMPAAPESSYAARGAGSNVIWVDPEHDLVAVVRWIDKASVPGFVALVMEGVTG